MKYKPFVMTLSLSLTLISLSAFAKLECTGAEQKTRDELVDRKDGLVSYVKGYNELLREVGKRFDKSEMSDFLSGHIENSKAFENLDIDRSINFIDTHFDCEKKISLNLNEEGRVCVENYPDINTRLTLINRDINNEKFHLNGYLDAVEEVKRRLIDKSKALDSLADARMSYSILQTINMEHRFDMTKLECRFLGYQINESKSIKEDTLPTSSEQSKAQSIK